MLLGMVTIPVQSQNVSPSSERLIDENTQTVYLNFDAGGLPTFPFLLNTGEIVTISDHIYTSFERDEIQRRMEEIFKNFNITFTHSQPVSGEFSTIIIGVDDDRLNRDWRGIADAIDFRNLNFSDTALVDSSSITAQRYNALQGSTAADAAFIFEVNTGLRQIGSFEETYSEAIMQFSAMIAAHELGHNLGLRHHDALGPIGSGALPGPFPLVHSADEYVPEYPGLTEANETIGRIMQDGSLFQIRNVLLNGLVFSERSAIKLSINEQLSLIDEVNTEGALSFQEIELQKLNVANPIKQGKNAGKVFDVEAAVVKADIAGPDDQDAFGFLGSAGDIVTIEVQSTVLRRYRETGEFVVTRLGLYRFDENNNPVLLIENFQDTDTFDPQILDFELPSDGGYVVLVNTSPEAFFISQDSRLPGTVPGSLLDRDLAFWFENGTYEMLIYKWGQPQDAPITVE